MEVRVAGRPVRNAREWVRHQNILKVNIVEVEADVVDINYGVRILTRFFPNSGQGRRQVQYKSVIAWDLGLEKIHSISDFLTFQQLQQIAALKLR